MDGLRPCPFCGGEAHVYEAGKGPAEFSTYKYNIECTHTSGCPIGESGDVVGDLDACSNDLDKLKEAWNRRAERTCRMAVDDARGEYRCSECGYTGYEVYRGDSGYSAPSYCARCGARVVGNDA